ncbi:MAG: hypothetical protein ACRC92_27285 [Peptostreptococcaceae bacterium]
MNDEILKEEETVVDAPEVAEEEVAADASEETTAGDSIEVEETTEEVSGDDSYDEPVESGEPCEFETVMNAMEEKFALGVPEEERFESIEENTELDKITETMTPNETTEHTHLADNYYGEKPLTITPGGVADEFEAMDVFYEENEQPTLSSDHKPMEEVLAETYLDTDISETPTEGAGLASDIEAQTDYMEGHDEENAQEIGMGDFENGAGLDERDSTIDEVQEEESEPIFDNIENEVNSMGAAGMESEEDETETPDLDVEEEETAEEVEPELEEAGEEEPVEEVTEAEVEETEVEETVEEVSEDVGGDVEESGEETYDDPENIPVEIDYVIGPDLDPELAAEVEQIMLTDTSNTAMFDEVEILSDRDEDAEIDMEENLEAAGDAIEAGLKSEGGYNDFLGTPTTPDAEAEDPYDPGDDGDSVDVDTDDESYDDVDVDSEDDYEDSDDTDEEDIEEDEVEEEEEVEEEIEEEEETAAVESLGYQIPKAPVATGGLNGRRFFTNFWGN